MTNLLVAILLTLGSLLFKRTDVTLGVALGAAISLLNFQIFLRIARKALNGDGISVSMVPRFGFKFLVLAAIVAYVLLVLPVEPIAFVVGISITLVSISLSGALSLGAVSESPESTDA